MPTEEAISRCGSLVSDWLITTKTTSPARRYRRPCVFGMILHPGGKMLLTRTRLKCAIPASRSAISKELSFSLWRPTPLVRKIFLDTNIRVLPPRLDGMGCAAHADAQRVLYRRCGGGSIRRAGVS